MRFGKLPGPSTCLLQASAQTPHSTLYDAPPWPFCHPSLAALHPPHPPPCDVPHAPARVGAYSASSLALRIAWRPSCSALKNSFVRRTLLVAVYAWAGGGFAPLERLPTSEIARLRLPVFDASRFRAVHDTSTS